MSNNLEKPLRILIDLDEVLVDFVGGACEAWGVAKEQVLKHWEPGVWDMIPPLSKALSLKETISEKEFWCPINKLGEGFWEDLKWLPWGRNLLQEVMKFTGDWWIASSPNQQPTSHAGKVQWIKQNFGYDFDRFVPVRHKYLMANPNTILIDDKDENIDLFREAGGYGIVFPRHHNCLHKVNVDQITYVKNCLTQIFINRRTIDYQQEVMKETDQFYAIISDMADLHRKKGADYGTDEDPLANLRATSGFGIPPWVGAVMRANDKIIRMQSFINKGKLENESLEDSLVDCANYFVLALQLYRETKGAK